MKNHLVYTYLLGRSSSKFLVLILIVCSISAYGQKTGTNGLQVPGITNGGQKSLDTDGDGILDSIDKDDDNDGIFDLVENNQLPTEITDWYNPVNINIDGNLLNFQNGTIGWENGVYSSPFYKMIEMENEYAVGFSASEIVGEAVIGFGIEEESNDKKDVDFGIHFNDRYFRIIVNNEFVTNDASYSQGDPFYLIYSDGLLAILHKEDKVYSKQLSLSIPFYVDTAFLGRKFKTRCTFKNFHVISLIAIDTDNDGLINSIDLDSDNDSCVDVVEAGFQDEDGDGILGTGTPTVDAFGVVTSANGYEDPGSAYLNPNVSDACLAGIVINTENMPTAIYEIVADSGTLINLTSGTPDSENTITVESGLNELLLNVDGDDNHEKLQLKITTLSGLQVDEVEVMTNGQWMKFSPEFYEIDGNKVSFKNKEIETVNPFKANLKNGVSYNDAEGLVVEIEGTIDLTNSVMKIYGPNGFNDSVDVNLSTRSFLWDGSQADPGKYRFSIAIKPGLLEDNANYIGQFIIQQ